MEIKKSHSLQQRFNPLLQKKRFVLTSAINGSIDDKTAPRNSGCRRRCWLHVRLHVPAVAFSSQPEADSARPPG
jgi:hypothetical protein